MLAKHRFQQEFLLKELSQRVKIIQDKTIDLRDHPEKLNAPKFSWIETLNCIKRSNAYFVREMNLHLNPSTTPNRVFATYWAIDLTRSAKTLIKANRAEISMKE
jgi:hypothetical protein